MRKILILLVCIIAGQSFVSLYSASPAQELGKWWKNSLVVGQLELSGEQIENIEQSYLDHRKTLVDLTRTLMTVEDRLKSLMEADAVDDGNILEQVEQVAEARKDLEMAQTIMMLSFRKEMNKEQWEKLEAMREYRSLFIDPMPVDVDASKTDARKMFLSDGTEFYVPGNGVKPPVVVNWPKPPYTVEAREAEIGGIVVLEAIVREDGSINNIKVLRSLGYGLDDMAIRTITEKWLFKPGMMNGQLVNTQVIIEVSFGIY